MSDQESLESYMTTFNSDYASKAVRAASLFESITGCEVFPLRDVDEIKLYCDALEESNGIFSRKESGEIYRNDVEKDLIVRLGNSGTHSEVGVKFTSEGRFPFYHFYERADALPDVEVYS